MWIKNLERLFFVHSDQNRRWSSFKKVFWKYAANLQNTHAEVWFQKNAKQLYWNHTLVWVFCCKFVATYFHLFLRTPQVGCFWPKWFSATVVFVIELNFIHIMRNFCVIYTRVLNIRSVEFIDGNIHEIEM